jgi:hypothetical protein
MNQPTPSSKPAASAFWWNVAVIVVGLIIAFCAILAWAGASTGDSAPRQTVAALWLIQGFIGLLIAAIGVLGATLVSLNMQTEPRAEPKVPPQPPSTEVVGSLDPVETLLPEGLKFTDALHQLTAGSVKILENAQRNNYRIEARHDSISLWRYGTLLRVCRSNGDIKTFGVQNGLTG